MESQYIPGTPGKTQITGIKPYTPFSENKEDYVAQFSPLQQQVFQEGAGLTTDDRAYEQASDITRGTAAGAAGYGQQGAGFGQQAAGYGALYEQMATDPMAVQAYMSPYMQQVVERQKQAAIEDAQRSNLAANLGASRMGSYGGARQLLAETQREAALAKQMGDIQALGLQSAFDKAQQAQQFGIQTGLQGLQTGIQGAQTGLQGMGLTGQMGAQLGNIATAQQQANLDRLGFQRELGAEQRAREQAIIDQQIQDFAMAQQYPFQQLSAYSGLLRGYATPTTSVSQYKAAPSAASQLAGTGVQLGGVAQAFGLGGKAGGQVKSFAAGGIAEKEGIAEMMSIPQLQQSIRNNTLPEYIGIPMLEERVDLAERMKLAQGIAPDMGEEPIADKVMARADQLQGIDAVATGAGGGIVAFSNGGLGGTFDGFDLDMGDGSRPDLSGFTDEEKLQYLQGRVGYPQIADLREGKISLDNLFESVYEAPPASVRAPTPTPTATPAPAAAPKQNAPAANQTQQAAPRAGIVPPAEKELSRAELFNQRYKEMTDFLGEDPRVKRMQENLKKQSEEPFLDRMLRGLQLVAAGTQLKEEGKTDQLEKAMAGEAARREAIAKRQEKQAELEGAEYQRKADVYGKVAEEDRERAKTKESQAFQERVLERKIQAEEKIARMRPASASEYIGNLLRSKSPEDRKVGEMLAGQTKTGKMTREEAVKLALQANPTLVMANKEAELEAIVQRILGTASAGGYTPTTQQQSILDKYNK
jgi:hypothetical protein